jgi:hypothetical protein
MKTAQIVKDLIGVAEKLGYRVRFDTGNFRGGHCLIKEESLILLNRKHPSEAHIVLLAEALRDNQVDMVFLRPAVRTALESAWKTAMIEGELPDEA